MDIDLKFMHFNLVTNYITGRFIGFVSPYNFEGMQLLYSFFGNSITYRVILHQVLQIVDYKDYNYNRFL